MKRIGIIVGSIALIVLAAIVGRQMVGGPGEALPASSLESLPAAGSAEGFARATEPDAIAFPRDLGPHDDYQTEWWYYTGNLQTPDGRPFGFQFTIFRRALSPEEEDSSSSWRTEQVYLAHFTISDIAGEQFYPAERFSRGAVGLAGATAAPYRVWLEDWTIEEIAPGQVRLRARTDAAALDLTLTETLPPVRHGDGGLSVKGPEVGNASYYYSIIRQQAAGSVTVGGETFAVNGLAWKDHEWSTSALSAGAVGWDWLSLQLDNGGALMLFEIRRADGTREATSAGSYIAPDGTVTPLAAGDWTLEVTDTWTSPTSGGEYPAGWRISVPSIGLEMEGRPLLADQELNLSTVYWEGAVEFSGTMAGAPIAAEGYIELTGYAGSMAGRL
ncbi:putative exported protein [Candidatus Promineifilum breve]|uniref:Exported protein n=1 Tax=Candidatus Promineifilum breve TaxID=1806508 RepID=A0A160T0N8_9CHLR|nr:lipocalin-like domain-containing protein [Candidatus Promineifilum breve]CUS03511.2 putative exported protein [Candidatus Promineifilum breve]